MTKVRANLSKLAERWPSALVTRQKIEEFSGGAMSVRFITNMDKRGAGPKGRIRINGKVAYPVDQVILWLEARTETFIDNEDTRELNCEGQSDDLQA